MRSLYTRLALVGLAGVALAACGSSSGLGIAPGGAPNGAGGGPVNVSQQNPSSSANKPLLIDGGTKVYTGYDTTAVDTLDTATPAYPKDPKGPTDVAGSHSIVYSGNQLTQQIFTFSGNPVNLVLPNSTPGDIIPVDFGAIVFFATPPSTASSLSIELTGGSGTTAYDNRISCTATATATAPATPAPNTQKNRYVCVLPAYGAASSTNIVNPVTTGSATGTFTPQSAKLYLVVNDSSPLASTSTSNTLTLDYLYAEIGTT
jgi:hypothetical protein